MRSVRIPLSSRKGSKHTNLHTLIDEQDVERVAALSWSVQVVNGAFYVRNRKHEVLLHRFLMNAAPGEEVDHINGDGLDNRRCNLRIVTHTQNNTNKMKMARNTSGYKGVTFCRQTGRWRTFIVVNRRRINIGRYDTPEEAARAYDEVARVHHGEYGRYNFPRPGERAAR